MTDSSDRSIVAQPDRRRTEVDGSRLLSLLTRIKTNPVLDYIGEFLDYSNACKQYYPIHPLGNFPPFMAPDGSRQLSALQVVLILAFGPIRERALQILQEIIDHGHGGWIVPVLLGYWQLHHRRYEDALRCAHLALSSRSNSLHALALLRDIYRLQPAAVRDADPERRREAEVFLRDNRDRFCHVPFTELITTEDGTLNTCCAALHPVVIGNMYEQSWEQAWNSPAAQEARRSILDGDYAYCNRIQCPYLQGNSLPKKSEVDDPVLRDIIDGHKTELDVPPKVASLGHDATCNLSCPQCRTGLLIARGGSIDRLKRANEDFVLPLTRHTAEVYVTNSGDPFASKHFREFLRGIRRETHPHLRKLFLLTNALLWTPKEWASLSNLHHLEIVAVVSIDAAHAATYREIRRRGDFARLRSNLDFIGRLRCEGQIKEFHLRFAVQTENFEEIPPFVRMGIDLEVDTIVFTRLMNMGTYPPDDFAARDICNPDHPRHAELLRVMADPVLEWENISWDNLSDIRRAIGLSDAASADSLFSSALQLPIATLGQGPMWRLARVSRLGGSLRTGGLPSARQPRLGFEATRLAADASSGEFDQGDLIVEDESEGRHRFEIVIRDTLPQGRYTFSFSARTRGRSFLQVETRDGDSSHSGFARFDLTKGAAATVDGAVTDPRIEEEGDGWFRISTTLPFGNSPFVATISLFNEREEYSYAGDGRSGVSVRDFSLESADAPSPVLQAFAGMAALAF